MNKGERVKISLPNHPISYSGPLVTNRYPTLSVSFPRSLPSEASDMLKNLGYTEAKVKGSTVYLINDLSSDQIMKIANMGAIRTCPAPANSANINSLFPLRTIREIFSCFFRLQSYPAFKDKDHTLHTGYESLVIGELNEKKRKAVDQPGPSSKRSTRKTAAEVAVDEDEPMENTDDNPAPRETIVWALPAYAVDGWLELGDEIDIPEGDGSFVQFLPELANTEGEKMVSIVIREYFLGCLGSSTNEVLNGMDMVRTAMGILNSTDVGKELNHMAWCIDAGIRAQSRVIPVLSQGIYHGCLLMGYGYTIRVNGTDHKALDHQSLLELVRVAAPHGATLRAIAVIVNGADDSDSEDFQRIVGCKGMAELRQELLKTNLTQDDRVKIVTLAAKLRFSFNSWGISPTNLQKGLSMVADSSSDIPMELPKIGRAHV